MALIRSVFQEELDSVSQSLVDLTNMVSESIHKATDSLIKVDLNLAEEVISYDEKIDTYQHELDSALSTSSHANNQLLLIYVHLLLRYA